MHDFVRCRKCTECEAYFRLSLIMRDVGPAYTQPPLADDPNLACQHPLVWVVEHCAGKRLGRIIRSEGAQTVVRTIDDGEIAVSPTAIRKWTPESCLDVLPDNLIVAALTLDANKGHAPRVSRLLPQFMAAALATKALTRNDVRDMVKKVFTALNEYWESRELQKREEILVQQKRKEVVQVLAPQDGEEKSESYFPQDLKEVLARQVQKGETEGQGSSSEGK